jgi:drug/metabolite transporter (DMT)-like permease
MIAQVPLIGSVVLGAFAQISLRHGLSKGRTSAPRQPVSPWVALWGICFVAATVLWLAALRRTDISYAYPVLGAGYALTTILAKWLLREQVSALRWIAVLVISAGVVMVGVSR